MAGSPSVLFDAVAAVLTPQQAQKLTGDGAAVQWFMDAYLHHIREEEQEQFVAAEKVLGAADLRYMRGVFNRRKKEEKAAAKVEKKISLKD